MVATFNGVIEYLQVSKKGGGKFMEKKLYRSRKNRVILGVCGGIAEYLNIDPTIVRLIFIFLLIPFHFTLIILYFLSAFVIPEEPENIERKDDTITPSGPAQHL